LAMLSGFKEKNMIAGMQVGECVQSCVVVV
jgi:hypothetical protein